MTRVAIVGVGAMGEALLAGLLRDGRPPADIVVADHRVERTAEVEHRWGVRGASAREAVAGADAVLLAVKPNDVGAVLHDVAPVVPSDTVVISIAAGTTLATLEAVLPEGTPVVRAMPNTPALVAEGMFVLSGGSACTEEHLQRTEVLLATAGRTVRLPENLQDASTATSGSGPAYVYFVMEAMIDAAVAMGIPPGTATELVVQTVVGSAKLIRDTGEDPRVLRERATSPAGTSAAAVRELDRSDVRQALFRAMGAARDRSRDLGRRTSQGNVTDFVPLGPADA